MTADAVAKIACRGMLRGDRVTIAGVANHILAFLVTHLPHWLTLPAAARLTARD
jgi:hypothetical protein